MAFIVTTTSITTSFKKIVKNKIINHDGFSSIRNADFSALNNFDYEQVSKRHNHQFIISKMISDEVIIRKNGYSEAAYLRAVESDKDIYNLSSVMFSGQSDYGQVLLGYQLAAKLMVNKGDSVKIIYNNDDTFIIENILVSGIYKTDIPDFDKYNILCDLSFLSDDINHDNFENIILNYKDNDIDQNTKINYLDDYVYTTWSDKYIAFLSWLNQFDVPINILLFFIMIICIINICSSAYIDTSYRLKELFLLKSFGFRKKQISLLYSSKFTLLSLIGAIIGFFLVLLLQYIQNTFHVITIPEHVYFMNYLPLEIDYMKCILFICLLPLLTFLLSSIIISAIINKKISDW